MFNFKLIRNAKERTLGVMVRVLGIDFTVLLMGWINDWMLVDLRLPVNYGIFAQVLFIGVSIGRLDDSVYITEG